MSLQANINLALLEQMAPLVEKVNLAGDPDAGMLLKLVRGREAQGRKQERTVALLAARAKIPRRSRRQPELE